MVDVVEGVVGEEGSDGEVVVVVVVVVVVEVVLRASSNISNFSLVSSNSFCRLVFCTAKTIVDTVNAVRAKPKTIETNFAVISILYVCNSYNFLFKSLSSLCDFLFRESLKLTRLQIEEGRKF